MCIVTIDPDTGFISGFCICLVPSGCLLVFVVRPPGFNPMANPLIHFHLLARRYELSHSDSKVMVPRNVTIWQQVCCGKEVVAKSGMQYGVVNGIAIRR